MFSYEFPVNSIVACNASCVSIEGFAIILSGFVWKFFV